MTALARAPVHPLPADALPAVDDAAARLARCAFDRRFAAWLQALAGGPAPGLEVGPAPADAWTLVLGFEGGAFELCVDPAAWPALGLVAALPEPPLALATAACLAEPVLASLRAALPGLHLRGLQAPAARPGPALHLHLPPGRAALLPPDDGTLGWLAGVLQRRAGAPKAALRTLRLPGRVRLFRRAIGAAELRSLGPGDVVVWFVGAAAGASLPCRVSYGWGTTMQAEATLDADAGTLALATAPRAVDEGAAAQDDAAPALQALGELGLPVAFEIDSARVSLDELAAFAPGAVIRLAMPLREAAVRLVCFGQVVGQGRLVTVGDCLGVCITRMGSAPAALQPAAEA